MHTAQKTREILEYTLEELQDLWGTIDKRSPQNKIQKLLIKAIDAAWKEQQKGNAL